MKTVSVVAAATTTSTSSYDHEKGAQTLQVCGHSRTWSPPNDSTPCSLVRLPEAAQLHHPAWVKSSHAHVHSYLTMVLCFPAPSDVAGHFVLWDVAGSCEDARGRCNGWV